MTRFNNKYPYTDFHELNADWLLETVKDAEAEAKEASDTVATYNDRLTTVEGDLAPIKAAMPGIASSISDLTSGLGRVSSQVTTNTQDIADNASNIDNIEDRLTTYDQNFVNINNTFISDERRIGELEEYRTEAQVKIGNLGYSVAPLFDENAAYNAGDYVMSPTLKLHRARVNIPAGTANINDLTQFQPTDINNALHEGALPLVTSADAGDVLTVDNNGDWVAATPYLPNAFDVLWNSTGTTVGSKTGNVSTPSTTLSIALSGQMNFTVTFKGILEITAQTGSVCYAKYLLYKRGGSSAVYASKLYEFGGVLSDVALSLTGGSNPGSPATALNVAMTVTSGMNAIVKLYSV